MWGTIVNSLAIIIGSIIGYVLKKGIPEKTQKVIMQAVGLACTVFGISTAIKTENFIVLIISLALGALVGKGIGIEDGLDKFGNRIQKRLSSDDDSTIASGFVTGTLLFCVGAMAVVGSIEAGTTHNYETLYIKSILDFFASLVFSSVFGLGVALSAVSVFVYQGAITLCSVWIAPALTDAMLTEISAVGGTLIIGIGINVMEIKKIHVGDMLPAIIIPPLYFLIAGLF